MWLLFLNIAGVALAVFGLLCAIYLLLELIPCEGVSVAVRIADDTARQQLDLLLSEAHYTKGMRRSPIIVLYNAALLLQQPLTPEERALLDRYRVESVLCLSSVCGEQRKGAGKVK